MIYDYRKAVKEDVKGYITENFDEEEIKEKLKEREDWENDLNEVLWESDSVTGNGSGSYTFSREEAGKNLVGNFDELADAIDAFGGDFEGVIRQGEEACDVTIRCYYLGECISEVLDEFEQEFSE